MNSDLDSLLLLNKGTNLAFILADKTVDFVFNCLNYNNKLKNEKNLNRKEKVSLFNLIKKASAFR